MFTEMYSKRYLTTDDSCLYLDDISMIFLSEDKSLITIYRQSVDRPVTIKNNLIIFNEKEMTLFEVLISSIENKGNQYVQ